MKGDGGHSKSQDQGEVHVLAAYLPDPAYLTLMGFTEFINLMYTKYLAPAKSTIPNNYKSTASIK